MIWPRMLVTVSLEKYSFYALGTDHLISRGGGGCYFSSRQVIFFLLFAQQVIFFKSKLQQDFDFLGKKHIKIRKM